MSAFERFGSPETFQGGMVSIGNFDGVHRGHQSMIEVLVAEAHAQGVPAVVLTFHPHPLKLLRPEDAPPQLCTLEHKSDLLARLGVDAILPYPTDWNLLQLTPEEFFENIVCRQLQARGLVEGPNFCFGRHRAGDIAKLRELCDGAGKSLHVISPVEIDGKLISSSRIRSLLEEGDFTEAMSLLGHPYRLTGRVTRGEERGRLLGFPTANLADIQTLLPADGVYAGEVRLENDDRHEAAIHIGPNPTFHQAERKVEVHILDFTGDLYDRTLHVDLCARIRETQKFSSVEELLSQLHRDLSRVRDIFDQMT
ncbi:MAG: bifunctional riboflavin kinase/FAD synthetase [Planctomycetaceae bacterium]